MIGHGGQIKLIDFGNAVRRGDAAAGHSIGTWGYAAPEAVGALPNFVQLLPDPAVDCYAAGLTLHQAATGRLIFENPTDCWAQMDARVPRLSQVLDKVPPSSISCSRT
ncbi:hypothetical protein ABZX12_41100 [Kribbella sp. NPDC003505]|uniref:protein kinase domain-containing protein n=1 Tax=Kribbella sp. NPDC003505 TaxID=3154448 RepID=UPI0033B08EAF